ncbi:metallo-beta-lactamase superfamily protein [Vogesella indigofera]|uniref:Metallo-beta-lactamase superfamily protein n=1 Tax=Vogesella indigofera TaxID=45465 RepID=A0A495BHI1_VOGIN|nr:MBL fold metallo-hydrolase [Vogesella indigofera]RKQ60807.1 metallo-beta-lactamase superfamily protein [Vogesella indigofera]
MNKLLALPVAGDSFLLRRGDRNILVDGGYGSRALIAALSAPSVAVNHLHIVVCTHADKDHAGGLTDLLEKSSVRVDEFWLPGSWADSLPALLQSPQRVVDILVAELDEFSSEEAYNHDEDDDKFESRVHARIAEERRNFQLNRVGDGVRADPERQDMESGLAWLKTQAANLELDAANATASAKAFIRGRRLVRYRAARRALDRRWAAFWISLIDTAERIRKIAVQAIRYNVKVRWFDFGEFAKTRRASGGEPGLLIPLNAVELVVPPRPINVMKYMVRLTPVNEESLVFLSSNSWEWPDGLGVVFTGDSPLGDGPGYRQNLLDWRQEPRGWVVATAPHHGSESNAVAYKHLQAMTHVVLWLRSGGSSLHPGPTFRKLHPTVRGCTHCPYRRLEREVAEVQLSPPFPFGWPLFRVRAHDCNC